MWFQMLILILVFLKALLLLAWQIKVINQNYLCRIVNFFHMFSYHTDYIIMWFKLSHKHIKGAASNTQQNQAISNLKR